MTFGSCKRERAGDSPSLTTLERSLESHYVAFGHEESRLADGMPVDLKGSDCQKVETIKNYIEGVTMKITKAEVFMLGGRLGTWRGFGVWRPVGCRIYTDEGIYGDGEAMWLMVTEHRVLMECSGRTFGKKL